MLGVHDPRTLPAAAWLNQAMMPLHFGDWGGGIVQWVYAVFGVGSVALIWLGLWLWADRLRQRRGTLWPQGHTATRMLGVAVPALIAACLLPLVFALALPDSAAPGFTAFALGLIGVALGLAAWSWAGARRASATVDPRRESSRHASP